MSLFNSNKVGMVTPSLTTWTHVLFLKRYLSLVLFKIVDIPYHRTCNPVRRSRLFRGWILFDSIRTIWANDLIGLIFTIYESVAVII